MNELIQIAKEKADEIRPAPFWSLNGELEPNELRRQIREMKRAGLGGFFMHARVGIKTEYMSDQWWECMSACIDEAKQCGIDAWGYDENGYPSGIAGGAVCDASFEYQNTWIEFLTLSNSEELPQYCVIAVYKKNGDTFVRCREEELSGEFLAVVRKWESRASDPLNADAVDLFIKLTHEEYYKRFSSDFGKRFPGFFTDEPQLKQFQLPWTKDFDKLFSAKYGYDLLDKIICLKYELDGYEKVRHDFWCLINELYCEVFGKKIQDWCNGHNCKYTGHIMGEDTILEQMGSNGGGAMPFYEYLDIPAMDWLGRHNGDTPLTPKQVSSVAAQLGKKKVLSETFALTGWDVSFEELKWMAQWQLVNGINMLCPHLESYSLKGMRKKDHPPSLFIHQNWWDHYRLFNDYISNLGSLLVHSKEACDVLLIHPSHSAHILYNGSSNCEAVKKLDREFAGISNKLLQNQIGFHYGDETIMKKYGRVENNNLIIGEMCYKKLILPNLLNILPSTLELLIRFEENGGKIYYLGEKPRYIGGIPDNTAGTLKIEKLDIANLKGILDDNSFYLDLKENEKECHDILVSKREYQNTRLLFIVNNNLHQEHKLDCFVSGMEKLCKVDLNTLEKESIEQKKSSGGLEFQLYLNGGEAAVLLSDDAETIKVEKNKHESVLLKSQLRIKECSDNCLTIDRADYKIRDGEWIRNQPVYKIQRALLNAKTDEEISLRFTFEINRKEPLQKFVLVCENIPEFRVFVNGTEVLYQDEGFYIDPALKKLNIVSSVKNGMNEIVLSGRFWQRKPLYDWLFRPKDLSSNFHAADFDFDSVTYDTELESIYLLGDFTVESKSDYNFAEKKAIWTDGPFVISDQKRTLQTGDITTQGFPFFNGKMTLSCSVTIDIKEDTSYTLSIKKPICPVCILRVNGKTAKEFALEKQKADITSFLQQGENEIELTLISSLRNILGPHHFTGGESYSVGFSTFADTASWNETLWGEPVTGNIWTDRYCFVQFGVENDE